MEKLPKRKNPRLAGYDYSQNGAYFITICTKDMQCVLGSIVGTDDHIGPQVMLSNIGNVVNKYLTQIPGIDRFVVMPNHIHLIIIKDSDNVNGPMWSSVPTSVSTNIRTFKTLVTKELGFSIWQSKFHDHIIRNEEDYLHHLQYIEENPRKWLLGKDEYYA